MPASTYIRLKPIMNEASPYVCGMSYTRICLHIVFHTKAGTRPLKPELREKIYPVIGAKIVELHSSLIAVNGTDNHLHCLVQLHPSITVADTVKKVKLALSAFIKDNCPQYNFRGWGSGYSCFSFNYRDMDQLLNYVNNQDQHHKKQSTKEELLELLKENQIEFNPEFFPDLDN